MKTIRTVMVTGGGGYVGSVLVPKLLQAGYAVRVIDWYLYGEDVLDSVRDHPGLEQIKGDIRDQELLRDLLPGCDAVIHLACISNDPSFELNPQIGRSVNYEAFRPLVQISMDCGVHRFIYASSSSVYGVSDEPNVTEEHRLAPLTDYSKYKALCEGILAQFQAPRFTGVIVRPATVCGYSPRQRLDLTVNILTSHAIHNGKITVFGGLQLRPNIHIQDMTDLYVQLLHEPRNRVAGKIFNVGYQNLSVGDIATLVRQVVKEEMPEREVVPIVTTESDDKRSYHISSEKIQRELGFVPKHTVEEAVRDLARAFGAGKLPNAMTDPRYYNVRMMQKADTSLLEGAAT
ncbi:MAG: NAD(P)-dependent oxidoreductase [Phycisphaeraceae bacterium]|nr:NAD(P)-dependent oxidoreductase [Phycisphaeraceae bacterium]